MVPSLRSFPRGGSSDVVIGMEEPEPWYTWLCRGPCAALSVPDRTRQPPLLARDAGGLRCGHSFCANRSQRLAEPEHATVGIRHGQRIAVLPVAGLELALEVRRPDLIGTRRLQTNGPGVFPRSPPAVLAKLAVSIQERVDCASGRKTPTRVPSLHDLTQLGCSPAVLLSKYQNLALDVFGCSIRMAIGSPGTVINCLQAWRPPKAGVY